MRFKWFLLAIILMLGKASRSQITANVYERLLYIRIPGGTASAFTIEVDGRQYIITAKHAVASLPEEASIEYERANKWVRLPVHIYKCEDPTDIAVLVPPYQVTTAFNFPFESGKISYGQDTFFLGFPYGITLNGTNVNGTLPMPFVKKAIYSGTVPLAADKHSILLLLDGFNNPGFSGGPVVYKDPFSSSLDYNVIGVISGFQPDISTVVEKHPIKSRDEASPEAKEQPWRIKSNSDGTLFEYKDTDKAVPLNTGIVRAFALFPAIELIRKHPTGPIADHQKMDFPTDR